jgi:hypothetical protein
VLDELPSLEIAATAVAVMLVWRVLQLSRGDGGLRRRRARVESARARDLVGIALLAGAVVYAIRVQRASTWFLVASGLAILAQLVGLYFRVSARAEAKADPTVELAEADDGEDDEPQGCPSCGHGTLIELDAARLLGGLSQLTPVFAAVCPNCGALSGSVEDPTRIPIGEGHGTTLRESLSGEDAEALQEPAEHDG